LIGYQSGKIGFLELKKPAGILYIYLTILLLPGDYHTFKFLGLSVCSPWTYFCCNAQISLIGHRVPCIQLFSFIPPSKT